MPSLQVLARATRARTVAMVAAPVSLGAALAYQRGYSFSVGWFVVSLVGAIALQLGANVLGDVADVSVDKLARVDRGAIATDPGLVEGGALSARAALRIVAVLWTIALSSGIALAFARTWLVVPLGGGGALLAWQYWWPPVRYGYRGIGALGTFIAFGPIAVAGSYAVQAGRLDAAGWWGSIVPGLFMSLVLFTHDGLHFRSDKAGEKLTPAARWGPEAALIAGGAGLTLIYVVLTIEVATRLFPVWALIAVVTALPVAASWARAFRDPLPQHVLNLLGACLGAGVLTTMTIAIALLFWR
jgi:1,4-dihydroxy-2-naphthoate octaprenyltransferase